jgi:uncharacterized membrane protein
MTKKDLLLSRIIHVAERYWWVAVGLTTVLLYVIIMILAQGQNVWFDEGYSIQLARRPIAELIALTAVDAHPPFYYLLLKAWASMFGWSEFAIRSLSALLAALTGAAILVLIKALFDRKVMLATIPFVIIAPFFLRYGYEIRMYALVGLIGVVATFVLYKAMHATKKRWWVLYAFLVALGMYTLYMSAVVWMAHVVWLLLYTRKSGRRFFTQPWVLAYVGSVILFAPYIPTLIHQLTHSALPGIGSVLTISGLSGVLSIMLSYVPNWEIGGLLSIALLTILGLGIYICRAIMNKAPELTRRHLSLLLLCFFVPLVFYIVVSLLPKPFFIPRYLAHIAIYFYALLGVLTALGWRYVPRVPVVIFGGLTLLLLILGVFQLNSTGNFNFERMQMPRTTAVREVVDCNDSSVVVADDPYTYIDSVYYYDGCGLQFYSRDPVNFAGGYAPLHDSAVRISDPSSITATTIYHLRWVGDEHQFVPSSSYTLVSSITYDKQVVDRYGRQP